MRELPSDALRSAPPGVRVAGVPVAHPERPVTSAPGPTKLDVVRYHERVAGWLLPELVPRPIAVVKCMGDRLDGCSFRKHPLATRDDEDESPPFLRLADIGDVVRTVQKGAYEFHTWGASFPRLERPDRITLDLDPDDALSWPQIQEAASELRALLDRLELRWFVKTTGGKGLHFVLPITRRHTWVEAREFARAIARTLEDESPSTFTASAGRDARGGRVHVDHLRNVEGATVIAAYSLRARPRLPVSMPIAWSDLAIDVRGDYFNIDNAPALLDRRRSDPWADYECSRQTLSASVRRAVHAS